MHKLHKSAHIMSVLKRENSVFDTEINHYFVFGTGNFELPYLAST